MVLNSKCLTELKLCKRILDVLFYCLGFTYCLEIIILLLDLELWFVGICGFT